MAQVVLERISKRFLRGREVLRNLNLEFRGGELTVLAGPSGSGKSTILRLIAGLEHPDQGRILIDDRDVTHLAPHQRDVAMVFQRPALYPHWSARRNLGFGLAAKDRLSGTSLPQRGDPIEEMAGVLGIEGLLDRLPGQLSGGEQQRVALGRALLRRPRAYLLDEPLSNLDGPLRDELRRELPLLHRRLDATIVYVTHDAVDVWLLADRLVVVRDGQLCQQGTPLAVVARPRHRWVATFLAAGPEGRGSLAGILEGRLVDRPSSSNGGGWSFCGSGAEVLLPVLDAGGGQLLAELRDRALALGVPSSAVAVTEARPATMAGLRMTVGCATRLPAADERLVLEHGAWRLAAKPPPGCEVPEGTEVPVVLDLSQAHWFDGASGLTVGHGFPPEAAGGPA